MNIKIFLKLLKFHEKNESALLLIDDIVNSIKDNKYLYIKELTYSSIVRPNKLLSLHHDHFIVFSTLKNNAIFSNDCIYDGDRTHYLRTSNSEINILEKKDCIDIYNNKIAYFILDKLNIDINNFLYIEKDYKFCIYGDYTCYFITGYNTNMILSITPDRFMSISNLNMIDLTIPYKEVNIDEYILFLKEKINEFIKRNL